ncbi:hypothetical protein [Geminicoccus roseus]|uniref:hypothetical protein n=1 Tax=Geminicoccus roseus TaxID=404900 RepID=UPI000413068B|nr:hypothetical protein [Geminicoccus roseus]
MNAIMRIGLMVLAILVAIPAAADGRERHHDRGRGNPHVEREHRRHWESRPRFHERHWRHHDYPTFRGRGRERGHWWHRDRRHGRGHHGYHRWHDRGHHHGYHRHRRPGLFFGAPFGRFYFRMVD